MPVNAPRPRPRGVQFVLNYITSPARLTWAGFRFLFYILSFFLLVRNASHESRPFHSFVCPCACIASPQIVYTYLVCLLLFLACDHCAQLTAWLSDTTFDLRVPCDARSLSFFFPFSIAQTACNMPPSFKSSAKRPRLTLASLSSYDDILTEALVDQVYYWTTIPKNKLLYHASRGLPQDAVESAKKRSTIRLQSRKKLWHS